MHAVSGSRQRITRSMSKERLDEHRSMLNDAKAPRKVTVSTRKRSCVCAPRSPRGHHKKHVTVGANDHGHDLRQAAVRADGMLR